MTNPTKLSAKEEKEFQAWWLKVSQFKNLDSDPDSKGHYYDYRGFWKNEKDLRDKILSDNPEAHFIDRYKLPGHPTFSTESIYSTKETLGGTWEQKDGKWVFHHSDYTNKYANKTEEYLKGTGETAVYKKQMENKKPDVDKFFEIVAKINAGLDISDDEYIYYVKTTPKIDDSLIERYIAEKRKTRDDPEYSPDPQLMRDGLMESIRQMQVSPIHKQKTLKLLEDREAQKVSGELSEGLNLILGASNIATSINQINSANRASKRSRRPVRPAVPQRDLYLQQALRNAEQGVFDAARATAPVEAQINDQYLSDIQDAKTASTGQAGAYGSYRQLAANRRNRATLNLAPIQDQVRRGQQERYDNLLGMRMGETQNMFNNNLNLYGSAIDQYNRDQEAAANLGSAGRENLRNSLYDLSGNFSNYFGRKSARRKYDSLKNQAIIAGLNPDYIVKTRMDLENNAYGTNYDPWDVSYNEQMYTY